MTGTVTIRFTSKLHPGSKLMAVLAQQEQFNHCMLIDGDGMAYEAVCWHGVRLVPVRVSMRGVKLYQDMVLTVPDIEEMRAFLHDKLGSGYDWPGAAGIPFLRSDNWQDADKWWCSELLIAALAAGGLFVIDFTELERGTPNDLYQYPSEKSPVYRVTT